VASVDTVWWDELFLGSASPNRRRTCFLLTLMRFLALVVGAKGISGGAVSVASTAEAGQFRIRGSSWTLLVCQQRPLRLEPRPKSSSSLSRLRLCLFSGVRSGETKTVISSSSRIPININKDRGRRGWREQGTHTRIPLLL